MRTLFAHFGGIGDFLLAFPALARLGEDGPVETLGQPERVSLAVAGGLAQAAHGAEDAGFDSVFGTPSEGFRALLARFDRAVVWMKDTGEVARAFRRCGVEDVRVFPGLPPDAWNRHAAEYYLSCLDYAPPQNEEPLLRGVFGPRDDADGVPSPDVVIHPGSGGKCKKWPLARFQQLAEELKDLGRSILWSTGPAEEGVRLPDGAERASTRSLVELARLLARAGLYIGNDSGITHLAAAVGCPTVAVFGPTNPRVWAPRGPHVAVVRGDPWPATSQVLAACTEPERT